MEKVSLKIIVLFCVTIIIIFFFTLYTISNKRLYSAKKNSKYTIARMTSNWHQKNNRGAGTDFVYIVNGIEISKTAKYDLKKGKRFLVLFDSLEPTNFIFLGNHELPYSVQAPSNGWKFNEIPIPLDSTELMQYFEKLGIN